MARRSDHNREELKRMILDSAWRIVTGKGFEGLTARAVAKDIGYAPGTIYNLFDSMDDLYLSVNALTLDKLYKVLSDPSICSSEKTVLENMKAMAGLYMTFAHENRAHWLMLFTHHLPEGQKIPQWYQEKIDLLFQPLEELLKPYYDDDEDKKRKIAARALWASIHGVCFLEQTGKLPVMDDKDMQARAMVDYLIESFFRGL